MTAAENQAIAILAQTVETYHEDIKQALAETERRLAEAVKFIGLRVHEVEIQCDQRKLDCAAVLAKRTVDFDAEIAKAKLDAIAECKAPSVYRLATIGAGKFALRIVIVLSTLTGLGLAVLGILKSTGVIGG